MRNIVAMVLFNFLFLPGSFGQQQLKPQLSQIPNGTLSGNMYTNDALGVSVQVPDGWKADPDPKGATLDWRGPNKPANKCSRILLWLTPVSQIEGRFNPAAAVFATDPACIGVEVFPAAAEQVKETTKAAKKMGDNFNYTPFMSPYGNLVETFNLQGRVVIRAAGGLIINAIEDRKSNAKEPLVIKTSFSFTEVGGYLIVWAYVANEPTAEFLKNLQLTLKSTNAKQ